MEFLKACTPLVLEKTVAGQFFEAMRKLIDCSHFFRVFHVEDIVANPDAKLRQVLMLSNERDEIVDERRGS